MTEPTTQALIERLARSVELSVPYLEIASRTTHDGTGGEYKRLEAKRRLELLTAALTAARAHLEQPTEPAPVSQFGSEEMQALILAKLAAPSTAGEQEALAEFALECSRKPNSIGDKLLFTRIAALLQSTALPVGDLTDERIESVYNLAANQHLRPQDKAIVYKFARALLAAARPQPVLEPLTNDFLQTNDYYLLHRFIETTEDDESYDITKAEIKRLADLGVVQSHGFGKYSVTMFGYWVHERYWEQNPSLPLKTNTDRDAEAAHGITQGGGSRYERHHHKRAICAVGAQSFWRVCNLAA